MGGSSGYGRYFEEFATGEVIEHDLGKTIFESDNNLFALLTMNHHPVHIDQDYAERNQHGRILVVGTLVFSLAVGLTVGDVSGKAIANLGYDEVRHRAPVFVNDTLRARTTVLDKRLSASRPDRGIVEVETEVRNQAATVVLTFKRRVLVKTRSQGT